MSFAAIALHFDSLSEAYGFPSDYRDPSFFELVDRFFEISTRFDFKYSIFLIGKDLEREENRIAVRSWFEKGHEIGNHSYAHFLNFGANDKEMIRKEVLKSHELIAQTIGTIPKGFAAPNWSTSKQHIEVLEELGYQYDASMMPSWIKYPAYAKMILNHLGSKKLRQLVHQKDLLSSLTGNRHAYRTDGGMTQLPLPTDRYRRATWHTMAFTVGWNAHEKVLKGALDGIEAFYYVIHPADLLSEEFLRTDRKLHLARVGVPLDQKKRYLEKSIEIIVKSGRKIVTMSELASKTLPKIIQAPVLNFPKVGRG